MDDYYLSFRCTFSDSSNPLPVIVISVTAEHAVFFPRERRANDNQDFKFASTMQTLSDHYFLYYQRIVGSFANISNETMREYVK